MPLDVPRFQCTHRFSDWPECTLEVQCACGHSSFPGLRLLQNQLGNQVIAKVVERMRCAKCKAKPQKVWRVAGFHRDCHGGPEPDWAVLIRVR